MQTIIELPAELKALLAIIVTIAVTEILKAVGNSLNVDLSGYAAQVTAAVVGSVLVLFNAVMTNVPAELAPIVQSLLGLAVVVLGSYGGYKVFLSNRKPLG